MGLLEQLFVLKGITYMTLEDIIYIINDAEFLILTTVLSVILGLGAWAFYSNLKKDESFTNIAMLGFCLLFGGGALLCSVVGWVICFVQKVG